jgi:hypothetical protein
MQSCQDEQIEDRIKVRDNQPMRWSMRRSSLSYVCLFLLFSMLGCDPVVEEGAEERCTSEQDEDGDGDVSCADSDCARHPACLGRAEHCYNGVDDDGDGAVDCQDTECKGRDLCLLQVESCTDGVDNDLDGDVDCADASCARIWLCLVGGEHCLDGVDNDLDGAADCDDADCANTTFCSGRPEDCSNQRDDDADGLVDCADSDCAKTFACQPTGERCDNQRDDDRDGLVDCADPDCAYTTACLGLRELCDNGLDDDGDGKIDCADDGCAFSSVCRLRNERCDNGQDDDGDGDVDCADADCEGVFLCLPSVESCTNGQDDNGDGDVDCADMLCVNHASCVDKGIEVCGNGRDDDGDGDVDCADADCAGSQRCLVPVELCADGVDNDGDGLVDCYDRADCASAPECPPATEEGAVINGINTCGDGVDNDYDGTFDCADTDCNEVMVTSTEPCTWIELECSDNIDNDGDGFVDCDDVECGETPECAAQHPELCKDGLNNDGIGLGDCQDEDCRALPICAELCGDGVDNNDDGLVDCLDVGCAGSALCPPTSCANPEPLLGSFSGQLAMRASEIGLSCAAGSMTGAEAIYALDATQTGSVCIGVHTDGFEPALAVFQGGCAQTPFACEAALSGAQTASLNFDVTQGARYLLALDQGAPGALGFTMTVEQGVCTPGAAEVCDDGIDNNANGLVDCAEPACATETACLPPEQCTGGVDEDLDGAIDCADADCANVLPCGPEICDDGIDNDNDGQLDCMDFDDCNMASACRFGSCGNPQFASSSIFGMFGSVSSAFAPACANSPGGPEEVYLVQVFQTGVTQICLVETGFVNPVSLYASRVNMAAPSCGQADAGCVAPTLGARLQVDGLTQNDRLYVVVDSEVGTTGSFQVEIQEGACKESGSVFTPLFVGEGQPASGSTLDGEQNLEPDTSDGMSPCGLLPATTSARESVHRWRPMASGDYCISTQGSAFDTVLYVRERAFASFPPDLACATDGPAGSAQAELTLTVMGMQDYAIIVDGQAVSDEGDYVLSVTPGACP